MNAAICYPRCDRLIAAYILIQYRYSKELKWMTELERRCAKIFKGKTTLTKTEFHHVIQYQVIQITPPPLL